MTTQANYTYRFADSTESFRAPAGMTEEQVALHAGRLNHASIDRVERIGNGKYIASNGRRGVNRRSAVITVQAV